MPSRESDACWWVRRLPLFCEHSDPQVAGVARVVAARAMRRHGLSLEPDGKVTSGKAEPVETPLPCEGASVIYTTNPASGYDHYQFAGDPIPFTGGGFYSHFAPSDAVGAMGGPEAYLAALIEALRAGAVKQFSEAFTEPYPEVGRRKVKKAEGKQATLF